MILWANFETYDQAFHVLEESDAASHEINLPNLESARNSSFHETSDVNINSSSRKRRRSKSMTVEPDCEDIPSMSPPPDNRRNLPRENESALN